ncbi:hypothetical protein M404DRAFT_23423 [Pisolithus tinctorius Marx 270]|uniref:Uncharacterized protein n=1 Tax=Pisolithus tinctorius Marx 270 TaxID=870435 RepID=A0A0C3PHM2_PISTI|nr:hypothetical protein M404DRAFT_23423 [Pisolithus tinctorius Marx 270]
MQHLPGKQISEDLGEIPSPPPNQLAQQDEIMCSPTPPRSRIDSEQMIVSPKSDKSLPSPTSSPPIPSLLVSYEN